MSSAPNPKPTSRARSAYLRGQSLGIQRRSSIAPAQFASLGKPIDEAAKKVKIIGIDSAVDTKALSSFLATDDLQAGRLAADALANAMTRTYADTEGDVAIITASPGTASPDRSATGFKEQVAKKYRALNVLPEKVANAQEATGLSIMKDLIAVDRDLRGVFVSNVIMAEGASQVVYNKESGDRINYVVFGSDDKLVKSLQDGTIDALIVQDPFRMGYDRHQDRACCLEGRESAGQYRHRRQPYHQG